MGWGIWSRAAWSIIRLAGFGGHFRLDVTYAAVVAALPLLIAMKALE